MGVGGLRNSSFALTQGFNFSVQPELPLPWKRTLFSTSQQQGDGGGDAGSLWTSSGKFLFDLLVRHKPPWSPGSMALKAGEKRETLSKYQASLPVVWVSPSWGVSLQSPH